MNSASVSTKKTRCRTAGLLALCAAIIVNPSAATAQVRSTTVVIDAGHGGFDRGGIPGQRVGEKNLTLDLAQRLRRELVNDGYSVVMTRNIDIFVPLPTRVAIANSNRGAIFVCIHFNSSTRSGANGIETYYYRSDSASLAANIHRNVVAGAPGENRGIRRRGYFVLRRTAIPSVLIECGFLTNPAEARLIQTNAYREKLAQEIARGIQGSPAPFIRPLTASLSSAGQVGPQPFNSQGTARDFVRASAVREKLSHRSKSSKKHRASKSLHPKTTKKKTSTTNSEN
jgi:N-acetylmuramoyl-L-alanine amidase